MDWKAILRPAPSKLMVFAAILVLLVPFIGYDNGIRCVRAPCPTETMGSIPMWLFLSYDHYIFEFSLLNLAAGAILSYIAACLMIYGAGRLKKK